jgi:hypothetical protein
MIPYRNHNTSSDITRYRAAENNSRQCEGAYVVADRPCTCTQRNLQERVTIQQHDDSDE